MGAKISLISAQKLGYDRLNIDNLNPVIILNSEYSKTLYTYQTVRIFFHSLIGPDWTIETSGVIWNVGILFAKQAYVSWKDFSGIFSKKCHWLIRSNEGSNWDNLLN